MAFGKSKNKKLKKNNEDRLKATEHNRKADRESPPHLRSAERIVTSLQLPKDLMLGAVILTITGQHEAYVENYRGIIEYTNQMIKLQTKTCRVCIEGKRLAIDYFTNDEMKITGEILDIKYY